MGIIFETIRTILYHQYSFSFDQIQPETKLELELGTDSREFFELIIEFETAFDIEINLDEAVKFITIQDVVDYIEEKMIERNELYKNLF